MNSAMHDVASGRAMLATEVVGCGTPVVFLHAGVCDSRMWRVQLDSLGANHQAIAYDRRGFGKTRAEQEDYSAVEDLKVVIDAVAGIAPVILVGCSQGGGVALDMALRYPSYVRALILISSNVSGAPAPSYSPAIETLVTQRQLAQKAGDLTKINLIQARILLDGPLQSEGRVKGFARDLFLAMNDVVLRSAPVGANLDNEHAFQCLNEIMTPSFVLWGEYDFPHIQVRSHHLMATLPNASGKMLRGVAHIPSLEQPEAMTNLIIEFIGRLVS